jgi:hypothetical protein
MKTADSKLDVLTLAMRREAHVAVQEALLRHKLLGETVVFERDGKPVEIPPWDIDVDASVLSPEQQEMARRANIMWADKKRP